MGRERAWECTYAMYKWVGCIKIDGTMLEEHYPSGFPAILAKVSQFIVTFPNNTPLSAAVGVTLPRLQS